MQSAAKLQGMKKRLHVALVTETWRPEINGVAMTLGRMTDGLLQLGHRVSLVRPRQHRQDVAASGDTFSEVLVAGLPIPGYRGLLFGLPARGKLQKLWGHDRPDVVQVATEGPLGGSAVAAARDLRIPVVSEFHTNFHAYSRHYGFGWLERIVALHLRRLHNRSDLTLVPTHAVADTLSQDGYRNLRVVSRGVDTRLFNPTRRSAELRRSWGANDDTLVVIHVGRLAPEKNLTLVQKAFAAIRIARPDARLVLVGDGPMRDRLQRAAGSDTRCIFAGMQRGESLATHYASGDLFLFPSLTETFGNVTTEALASGLGVLAYQHAAAGELIADGYNGRLVVAGDVTNFIGTAIALAKDTTTLAKIRHHAAASVRHLDWDQVNEKLVKVFEDVISRNIIDRADTKLMLAPD